MYKLKKIIDKIQLAKYYEDESLAKRRRSKDWELLDQKRHTDLLSQSLNEGELADPKFMIELDGVEIKCPSEGAANQIMERLAPCYKNIKVHRVFSEDVEVLPDDGGI